MVIDPSTGTAILYIGVLTILTFLGVKIRTMPAWVTIGLFYTISFMHFLELITATIFFIAAIVSSALLILSVYIKVKL